MNFLSKAFKDTIVSNEAVNLAKDYTEIALDSLLSDGLLKEIPVVSTLISIGKITFSIKDRQTFKKIVIFLSKLSDIPYEDRKRFAQKLDEDDKFKETTSEKILLQLERLDETAKAEIIGNLFKLYILDVIDKYDFMRFTSIVEKAYFQDLLTLSTESYYFEGLPDVPIHHGYHVTGALMAFGLYDQILQDKPSVAARAQGFNGITELDLNAKLNPQGQFLANIMYYDINNHNFIEYMDELKGQKGKAF